MIKKKKEWGRKELMLLLIVVGIILTLGVWGLITGITTPPKIISSVGLSFDIVGAFLIWKFGLQMSPNPDSWKFKEGKDQTKWGLGLLGVGFLLQLISNWV